MIMNNLLENKIREHAGEIFDVEPLNGHRDRFADRLDAVRRAKRIHIYKIFSYISVAAVFAGCVFLLHRTLKNDDSYNGESLAEVQAYYSMQLQEKIEGIEQLLQQIDEEDRISLMKDIETLQEDADLNIQLSSESNPEFIVMTYSSKIEALQHIHNILTDNL
jgi:DNA-binding transcriptional MerR regulator